MLPVIIGISILFLSVAVLFWLLKRKRYKIKEISHSRGSGVKEVIKKVLVEKSLYNEIIAVYNIFSHHLDSLDPRIAEAFKTSPSYNRVKAIKYKLMTPGMEGSRLLFTPEEFELLKEGLMILYRFLQDADRAYLERPVLAPDLRLISRVFEQLAQLR